MTPRGEVDISRTAGGGARTGAGEEGFHARWVAALTELEVDVAEAERSLTGDHMPERRDPWQPPQELGPMPASLRTRAQALLERQTEVARQVAEAAAMSRKQARAVQAMRANGPARPVYVDMAG
ncbi:hypothetical protein ACFSBG_07280 [Georgenia yuyongxinii]|uniref:hypothetical protein n=1 Tax=Georgenia yuyongxinii TaxID=2589797 RepID=UPI001E5166F7|nr:hypothetical protein [Georgenia yuyongxinii]